MYRLPIVGEIQFSDGEKVIFINNTDYLHSLKEHFDCYPISDFSFKTFSADPQVQKAADDLFHAALGEVNPYSLNDYTCFQQQQEIRKMCQAIARATKKQGTRSDLIEYHFDVGAWLPCAGITCDILKTAILNGAEVY